VGNSDAVRSNRIFYTFSTGIQYEGDDCIISDNLCDEVVDDANGIDVSSLGSGAGTVSNNCDPCAQHGFNIASPDVVLSSDVALECGTENEHGFNLSAITARPAIAERGNADSDGST